METLRRSFVGILLAWIVLGLLGLSVEQSEAPGIAHAETLRADNTSGSTSTALEDVLTRARSAHAASDLNEAATLYRTVLIDFDRDHAEAYETYEEIIARLGVRDDRETERLARSRLNGSFKRYTTEHFVVFSDADVSWTRKQMTRLERAHHQFFRFAESMDLNPISLDRRLVCILFGNHDDFARFGRTHDDVHHGWIAGYYASGPNYVVFYNTEDSPSLDQARQVIAREQERLEELVRELRSARADRNSELAAHLESERKRFETHIAEQQQRIVLAADESVTAKTLHEAVHQIAFNAGIQSRYREYPFWLSEGLATCFETDRPNGAFGPAYEYDRRREVFSEILHDGRLIPLKQFVIQTDVPHGSNAMAEVMYHQSYAFMTWMARFRAEELRTYLILMAAAPSDPAGPPSGSLSHHQHLALFKQCFGDPGKVERDWLRWEQSR